MWSVRVRAEMARDPEGEHPCIYGASQEGATWLSLSQEGQNVDN